jgi:DNA-binding MarR family transcriptional regulator
MEDILVSLEGNINGMEAHDVDRDAVDRIIAQWGRERPELDTGPMAVVGRLHRLAALLEAELRNFFAEAGLGNGDFDVLATLRRSGEPFRLSPGRLAASTMVTAGAISKRLDRLEERGLVRRRVSKLDGRGRDVELTARGRSLTDDLVARHWANEDRLISALDTDERAQLVGLLRKLLLDVEGPGAGPVDD